MFKVLIAYISSFLFIFPALGTEKEIFPHSWNGREYVCFDPDSARELLDLTIKFPKMSLQLDKYKELSNVRALEINTLTAMHTNLTEQRILLIDENVALQKELDKTKKWYKSPWFWLGVGIVISGITFVALEEEYGPFFK